MESDADLVFGRAPSPASPPSGLQSPPSFADRPALDDRPVTKPARRGDLLLRVRLSRILSDVQMGPLRRRYIDGVSRDLPSTAEDYGDLHPSSLALLGGGGRASRPVVRILLPVGAPQTLFAGMRTAIVFAGRLAAEKDMPLEIVHFDRPRPAGQKVRLAQIAAEVSGIDERRVSVRNVWIPGRTHDDDLTVATFWDTALAAQVAARAGRLEAARVIYLVQDYEPEFYPGSSESALAKATYHAGFRLVVNSSPLADYLTDREGLAERPLHVFRPEIDVAGAERAAHARTASRSLRVTFYGRPLNTRNSFQLGVASLRLAARRLEESGVQAEFVSVGEKHPDIRLPKGRARSLGKLGWDEYFSRLAKTDVMVSFQQTPHPSHPPLDAIASGTFAVMNEMSGSRGRLSPRLLATESDPVAIADSIVLAGRRVADGEQLDHVDQDFVERLGRPLAEVVTDVASAV